MKKLRWAMDGGFWDVDVSTPRSLDGVARPVGGHPLLPLGLSRGTKLSRPKQIDFMQRFMTLPFVPSYAAPALGFTLQRVLTFPFSDSWFAALLGQFNVQKFVSSIKKSGLKHPSCSSSWLRTTRRHLLDESLYALGFCSELLLTSDDTLLLSLETDATHHSPRKKAVLQHQFPHHNLIVEVASAGLFIDRHSAYWDVPLSIAIDLASIGSDSGLSYHLCLHQNVGTPKQYQGDQRFGVPGALQSGSCVKTAFSFKRNIDIWRSTAHKLKMVQPFDVFLSSPHISASGVIGAVASASVGNNSVTSLVEDRFKALEGYSLHDQGLKSAFSTDIFASLSFTAQHGNFQRLFSDLTRIYTQLDFPSGLKFLSGISQVARDVYNCQQPRMEAVQTICPSAFISLQQQIVGPFSFRVDSAVTMDWKTRKWCIKVDEPVFAIEYALQVLGSAKAVAWYSVKHQEFMVELRFFEK